MVRRISLRLHNYDCRWTSQRIVGPSTNRVVSVNVTECFEQVNVRACCASICTHVQYSERMHASEHAFSPERLRDGERRDTAAIVLRFANGALGNFILSDTAASVRSWEQTRRRTRRR
jgi:hypothetical protein